MGKMRITQQDYDKLSQAIRELPIESILEDCKEMRYSLMATRWAMYHQANKPPGFAFSHLHEYLNDEHIDTALRKITGEF